jgi:hypothetical protein
MRINLISQKSNLKIQDIYKMFPNPYFAECSCRKINKEVIAHH